MWNAGGTSTPAAATTKLSSRGTFTAGARSRPPDDASLEHPPPPWSPCCSTRSKSATRRTAAAGSCWSTAPKPAGMPGGRGAPQRGPGRPPGGGRRGRSGTHPAPPRPRLRDHRPHDRTAGPHDRPQAVTPARLHGLRASLSPTALAEAARHRRRPAPLIDHRVHLPPPAEQWTRRSPGGTALRSHHQQSPAPASGEHVSTGQNDYPGAPVAGSPAPPRPPPRRIRP